MKKAAILFCCLFSFFDYLVLRRSTSASSLLQPTLPHCVFEKISTWNTLISGSKKSASASSLWQPTLPHCVFEKISTLISLQKRRQYWTFYVFLVCSCSNKHDSMMYLRRKRGRGSFAYSIRWAGLCLFFLTHFIHWSWMLICLC